MIRLSWCSIVCYIVCLAMKMSLKSRRRKCFSQPALTWYSSILLFTGGDKCQAFTEDWCFSLRDLKVRRDGDNNLFVLCTEYLAADVPISTSVKLGEVSGVELVSICEAYATTPLVSCGTTFQLRRSQYYRCPGARYAFVSRLQHPPQTTGNEANISAGDRAAGWP